MTRIKTISNVDRFLVSIDYRDNNGLRFKKFVVLDSPDLEKGFGTNNYALWCKTAHHIAEMRVRKDFVSRSWHKNYTLLSVKVVRVE